MYKSHTTVRTSTTPDNTLILEFFLLQSGDKHSLEKKLHSFPITHDKSPPSSHVSVGNLK
jgi:hypothetical protein